MNAAIQIHRTLTSLEMPNCSKCSMVDILDVGGAGQTPAPTSIATPYLGCPATAHIQGIVRFITPSKMVNCHFCTFGLVGNKHIDNMLI